MPKPRPGQESKSQYLARAIPMMIHEGLDTKAAQGKAFGWWEHESKKKGKKRKK